MKQTLGHLFTLAAAFIWAATSYANWEEWFTQVEKEKILQPPTIILVSSTSNEVTFRIENRSQVAIAYDGFSSDWIKPYIKWFKDGEWHYEQHRCGNAFRTFKIESGQSVVVKLSIWAKDVERWQCYTVFYAGRKAALVKLYETPPEHSSDSPIPPTVSTGT